MTSARQLGGSSTSRQGPNIAAAARDASGSAGGSSARRRPRQKPRVQCSWVLGCRVVGVARRRRPAGEFPEEPGHDLPLDHLAKERRRQQRPPRLEQRHRRRGVASRPVVGQRRPDGRKEHSVQQGAKRLLSCACAGRPGGRGAERAFPLREKRGATPRLLQRPPARHVCAKDWDGQRSSRLVQRIFAPLPWVRPAQRVPQRRPLGQRSVRPAAAGRRPARRCTDQPDPPPHSRGSVDAPSEGGSHFLEALQPGARLCSGRLVRVAPVGVGADRLLLSSQLAVPLLQPHLGQVHKHTHVVPELGKDGTAGSAVLHEGITGRAARVDFGHGGVDANLGPAHVEHGGRPYAAPSRRRRLGRNLPLLQELSRCAHAQHSPLPPPPGRRPLRRTPERARAFHHVGSGRLVDEVVSVQDPRLLLLGLGGHFLEAAVAEPHAVRPQLLLERIHHAVSRLPETHAFLPPHLGEQL
eukprot:scaffold3260_cov212-Isochrysis_galbana.AAC.6